jgi:hypothetical protein
MSALERVGLNKIAGGLETSPFLFGNLIPALGICFDGRRRTDEQK